MTSLTLQSRTLKLAAASGAILFMGAIFSGCTAPPSGYTSGIQNDKELLQEGQNLDSVNVDAVDKDLIQVSTDASAI